MNKKGFTPILIALGVLLVVGIVGAGLYYLGFRQGVVSSSNLFIGQSYNVKLPSNFYIFYRYEDDFSATNKKWEGKSKFYPSVGIHTYTGDIPAGMKLRQWLEKVGKTQDWTEFTNVNIPCR
ncbi:MAG: hypothetical protein Q8Q91_00685, partial [Candidatus Daviesbacteria bacterium]|nr:hypothetical protein [Candidatus Daviesbacteria bacterium]